MKKQFALFALLIIFGACSVGVKKDLITGMNFKYEGLSVVDVYPTQDNERMNSNEAEYGRKLYIQLRDVGNLTEKDGLANIGCAIEITDTAGNKILESADIFEGSKAKKASELSALFINLDVIDPLVVGQKYLWKANFFDKNGKGHIDIDFEFVVKAPAKKIFTRMVNVESGNCDFTLAGILNESEEQIDVWEPVVGQKYLLNLNGVKGIKESDGIYSFDFTSCVIGAKGDTLAKYDDVLTTGKLATLESYITISPEMKTNSPCQWVNHFKDKNSTAYIKAMIPMNVK
ncbi:MAG: hypothetical protein KKA07_05540 [Bacteroidetes bacterium]|nr:hypothetical protein [Bacteroidota bacterium]MBU1718517.1 hypothetical protein [Bacteroidota bacterium]